MLGKTRMTRPDLKTPLILVNLKTYKEALGEASLSFARSAKEVSNQTGICIAVAPQTVDLRAMASTVGIPVLAQHIDPIGYGKYTGHILPEAVRDAGAVGTLLNHSERHLDINTTKACVKRAWETELKPFVCVDTVELGKTVAAYEPYAIAIEPPELIGSGISVSKARPEVISSAVEAVKKVNAKVKVLCGAGITSGNDVSAALKLGAEGILVASGVVQAKNQLEALLDLASAAKT